MAQNQEAAPQPYKLDVRVSPIVEPQNKILALASVSINDIVAIHGIRVMDSDKGKFAAMPSMKDREGQYRDVAHPLTGDLHKQLNAAVLSAYEEALAKGPQEKASVRDQIKDGAKGGKDAPAPER